MGWLVRQEGGCAGEAVRHAAAAARCSKGESGACLLQTQLLHRAALPWLTPPPMATLRPVRPAPQICDHLDLGVKTGKPYIWHSKVSVGGGRCRMWRAECWSLSHVAGEAGQWSGSSAAQFRASNASCTRTCMRTHTHACNTDANCFHFLHPRQASNPFVNLRKEYKGIFWQVR